MVFPNNHYFLERLTKKIASYQPIIMTIKTTKKSHQLKDILSKITGILREDFELSEKELKNIDSIDIEYFKNKLSIKKNKLIKDEDIFNLFNTVKKLRKSALDLYSIIIHSEEEKKSKVSEAPSSSILYPPQPLVFSSTSSSSHSSASSSSSSSSSSNSTHKASSMLKLDADFKKTQVKKDELKSVVTSSSFFEADFISHIPKDTEKESYWQYLMEEASSIMTEPKKNQASNQRLNYLLDELRRIPTLYPDKEENAFALTKILLGYLASIPKQFYSFKEANLLPAYYSHVLNQQEDVPSDGDCFFWACARQLIYLLQSRPDLMTLLPEDFIQHLQMNLPAYLRGFFIHELLNNAEINRPVYYRGVLVTLLEHIFQRTLRITIASYLDQPKHTIAFFALEEKGIFQIGFIRDLLICMRSAHNIPEEEEKKDESIKIKHLRIIAQFLEQIEEKITIPIRERLITENKGAPEEHEIKTQIEANTQIVRCLGENKIFRQTWYDTLDSLQQLLKTDGFFVGDEASRLLSRVLPGIAIQSTVHTVHNDDAIIEAKQCYINGQQVDSIPSKIPSIHLIKVPWAHYHSAGLLVGRSLSKFSRPSKLDYKQEDFIRTEVRKALGFASKDSQSPYYDDGRKEGKISFFSRDRLFFLPVIRVKPISPLSVIQQLYKQSRIPEQKQACLRYVLHYQQYNANYTDEENNQLGYLGPLCARQDKSNYFRVSYSALAALIKPWIDISLLNKFFEYSFGTLRRGDDSFRVISPDAINVLKAFLFKKYAIYEWKDFCKNQPASKESKLNIQQVVIVRIPLSDLKYDIKTLLIGEFKALNLTVLKSKFQNLGFIFLLTVPDIDCILMWEAKWGEADNLLRYSNKFLKNEKELVRSILNKAGAVPDRLAVNQLLTYTLGDPAFSYESDLTAIGVDPQEIKKWKAEDKKKDISSGSISEIKEWSKHVTDLEHYKFGKDCGLELYRRAILQWQDVFFDAHTKAKKLAAPLLCSQVKPWLSQELGIEQWAKGYQNLCEIVMFCLEYFPELFSEINFESTVLNRLDPGNRLAMTYKTVGLYPYGMTPVFNMLNQTLNREDFKRKHPSIACISQNYFEILELLEKMERYQSIAIHKRSSLNEIKEPPSILIADIHPNNAAKEELFQNDIASYIKEVLIERERKMILILDVTMNDLADRVIQETLKILNPFIIEGRLEIFFVQSLAKLIQLGGDNFSGGMGIYIGAKEAKDCHPVFPKVLPQQAAYFNFLFEPSFRPIIADYFLIIRQNTDWMYKEITKGFSNLSENIWIDIEDEAKESDNEDSKESKEIKGDLRKLQRKERFCAVKVIPNVDEHPLYVALSFTPFFDTVKSYQSDKDKTNLVNKFRKLILKLAANRGLPITGRQSFGFALSNMTTALYAIRFSIGVEDKHLLGRYLSVLSDFNYALSRYVAHNPGAFSIDTFKKRMIKIYNFWREKRPELKPIAKVPLKETGMDEDVLQCIGDVDILFVNNHLRLHVRKESSDCKELKATKIISEPNIGIPDRWYSRYNTFYWAEADLFKLFFHIVFFSEMGSLYVQDNDIGGFIERDYLFTKDSKIEDEKSEALITFEPEFRLIYQGVPYTSDHVFVKVKPEFKLGDLPVELSKLAAAPKAQNEILVQLVRYHLKFTINYEGREGVVLVELDERKPYLDYFEHIRSLISRGSLSAVVTYLNELKDLSKLPILENQMWYTYAETPLRRLHSVLEMVGAACVFNKFILDIVSLKKIENESFRQSIMDGLFSYLFGAAFSKKSLDQECAEMIAVIFSDKEFKKYIDGGIVDNWILNIAEDLEKNKNSEAYMKRLRSYLIAIFPIILACYDEPSSLTDTKHSIPLRKIGKICKDIFPSLEEKINQYEQKISQHVADRLNQAISFTYYLQFYVRYPNHMNHLDFDMKRELVTSLQTKPEELRKKWIIYPDFLYRPINEIDIRYHADPGEFVFERSDQKLIRKFFVDIGCKTILLKKLSEENAEDFLSSAMRWGIIINDPEIFSKILNICNRLKLNKFTQDDLKRYSGYLDKNNLVQNQLAEFLELMSRAHKSPEDEKKTGETASSHLSDEIEEGGDLTDSPKELEKIEVPAQDFETIINLDEEQLKLKEDEIFQEFIKKQKTIESKSYSKTDDETRDYISKLIMEEIMHFKANAFYEKSRQLYKEGLYEEANEKIKASLKLKPYHAKALFHQGLILDKLDCFISAYASYLACLKIEPNNHTTLKNIGDMLRYMGHNEQARIYYNHSLAIRSGYQATLPKRSFLSGIPTLFSSASYSSALASSTSCSSSMSLDTPTSSKTKKERQVRSVTKKDAIGQQKAERENKIVVGDEKRTGTKATDDESPSKTHRISLSCSMTTRPATPVTSGAAETFAKTAPKAEKKATDKTDLKAATGAGASQAARSDDGQTSYEETLRRIEQENQEAKLKALEKESASASVSITRAEAPLATPGAPAKAAPKAATATATLVSPGVATSSRSFFGAGRGRFGPNPTGTSGIVASEVAVPKAEAPKGSAKRPA